MILGIESSCDESALAVFDPARGIAWESVYSQLATHAPHGGVVPELAVREHLRKFPELMKQMPVPMSQITKVAVTVGPGLAGSLAMGMALGKALALEHRLPLIGVNHLRAHAWSVFMKLHANGPANFEAALQEKLPHLGLLVSGGNTLLYEISSAKDLKMIARTQDDAAGEALDKAAKMLGLPYPGGPLLEKLAAQGNPKAFDFPIPFKESSELAFSFSGLKTSLRYQLQKMSAVDVEAQKADLAASFQAAVIEGLLLILKRALKRSTQYKSLGLCGGVTQNNALRAAVEQLAGEFKLPPMTCEAKHCGDNAAMIAWAAWADSASTPGTHSFDPGLTIDQTAGAR